MEEALDLSFDRLLMMMMMINRLNVYIYVSKICSLEIHMSKNVEMQSWIIHASNSFICKECTKFSVYNLVSITRTMKGATCV